MTPKALHYKQHSSIQQGSQETRLDSSGIHGAHTLRSLGPSDLATSTPGECVRTQTHSCLFAHVHPSGPGGSSLLHMVLCSGSSTAGPIPSGTTATWAAAQHLSEVVHDCGFFGVKQVELSGEKDEVHVQCVQMSVQLKGQGLLEMGPVDVAQYMKQILADLLHQGLKGAGEFSA